MEDAPDIAVVDIYLNGARDGIETARTLRELCGVSVVFVTAYSDEEGLVERIRRQVPGAPLLSKPLYGHRLADTIAEIRHLPVKEGDHLVGIISIGDVLKHRLGEVELEASVLRDYAIATRR
jgi:CheY-like chemotaxis protein